LLTSLSFKVQFSFKMTYAQLLIAFLGCSTQLSSAYKACKEPQVCECITACPVYRNAEYWSEMEQDPKYVCEKPLNVLPTLKIMWGPRLINQQITWAKEKLAYEAGKTYDQPWKDHVIDGNKAQVDGMYALLGMAINTMKTAYVDSIKARALVTNSLRKCDFAMCIAYCMNTCESMCDELESTDEAYLEKISWTKDMCDLEASKAEMKQQCNDLKAAAGGCDANCDGAESAQIVYPLMLLALSLAFYH